MSGLGGGQCSYLDQCVFALLGAEDVFEWLVEDFKRHYDVSINHSNPMQSKAFVSQSHVPLVATVY